MRVAPYQLGGFTWGDRIFLSYFVANWYIGVLFLFKAPNTNTSYDSTHPSTDTVEINSENRVPSDGYNARRMKLANKRKVTLERKLHQTATNKTEDLVSSSGLTSPTPSSSVLNDDRDTDCVDDYASNQPYSFGTVYSSRKSTGNFSVDDHKTCQSEHLRKSQSEVSLKDDSEDTNTYIKTRRSGSFQENSRKGVVSNLTADVKKETGVSKDSYLSLELNPIEIGLTETLSVNKTRKGSLVMEKINDVEEESVPPITNRSSSRRGSLAQEKTNSAEEESTSAINRSYSRKGSLKREKINFLDEESIPALGNRHATRKASISNEIDVDMDSVKYMASDVTDQAYVPSDEDRTKSDAPSKYIFPRTTEHLSEISRTLNKIQNTFVSESDVTEDKLKQFGNTADSEPLEIKGYKKKKLLAALKAIDDEEDSSLVNQGHKGSSVLDSLLSNSVPNPGSSLNVALPLTSYK
jgi:hypothetical protein